MCFQGRTVLNLLSYTNIYFPCCVATLLLLAFIWRSCVSFPSALLFTFSCALAKQSKPVAFKVIKTSCLLHHSYDTVMV